MAEGRSSIYISHRLASTRFCDRIILLDGSVIAEEGTHDELMALGGKYKEFFDVQSKYYKDGGKENEEENWKNSSYAPQRGNENDAAQSETALQSKTAIYGNIDNKHNLIGADALCRYLSFRTDNRRACGRKRPRKAEIICHNIACFRRRYCACFRFYKQSNKYLRATGMVFDW